MPRTRRFAQVDVFSVDPTFGNGLAVVLDAEGMSTEHMQRFAAWTNLAETTFILPPDSPEADYTIRIFAPRIEMPFAGHPTLGSAHAWRTAGGVPKRDGVIVQSCKIGLVEIDISGDVPAFAAPATKIAPLPEPDLDDITSALGLPNSAIKASAILDNGPVWKLVELADAKAVLDIDATKVIGTYPEDHPYAYETRNISPSSGMIEDPITGSMNAAIAHWLAQRERLNAPLVISQGTKLGCTGRVHVTPASDGRIWIGGHVNSLITGQLEL